MSRAKTFKKSLRESFRRLRKGRGTAATQTSPDSSPQKKQSPKHSPKKTSKTPTESPKKDDASPAAEGAASIEVAPGEGGEVEGAVAAPVETVETGDTSTKPVEREITARSEKVVAGEEITSMVRCAMFADTFVMRCES